MTHPCHSLDQDLQSFRVVADSQRAGRGARSQAEACWSRTASPWCLLSSGSKGQEGLVGMGVSEKAEERGFSLALVLGVACHFAHHLSTPPILLQVLIKRLLC